MPDSTHELVDECFRHDLNETVRELTGIFPVLLFFQNFPSTSLPIEKFAKRNKKNVWYTLCFMRLHSYEDINNGIFVTSVGKSSENTFPSSSMHIDVKPDWSSLIKFFSLSLFWNMLREKYERITWKSWKKRKIYSLNAKW